MKFTDIFVKRPVLATVVNLVILIAGLQAIRSLSVRQYPRSDIAVVQITTVYVGANADLVRGFVTTPIERVVASADGIDYMESTSAQGLSTIQVHLKINYDTTAALTQIQAKVAQVRNDLPPDAQIPVIDLQTADTQFAAMYLGFSSKDLDQNQITDYLTRVVQPKLSAISGVQRADILGNRTFAMRLWLKPQEMAARGVSPSDVHDALSKNNYLSALGSTKGSMVSVNLVANTDLRTPEEFRQMVIKENNGTVVRLGEIADVQLGAENYDQDVRFNGETATFMGIWVLPTANSLDVIKAVRAQLPAIEAQLPTGMKAGVPYDSTEYIQDAIDEVLHTLTETLIIVIVVIFLFLGSFRSVLIPIVAIPISLIGAVFLMLAAGFTINLLTLLAIVLSVGLVVDDASAWTAATLAAGGDRQATACSNEVFRCETCSGPADSAATAESQLDLTNHARIFAANAIPVLSFQSEARNLLFAGSPGAAYDRRFLYGVAVSESQSGKDSIQRRSSETSFFA